MWSLSFNEEDLVMEEDKERSTQSDDTGKMQVRKKKKREKIECEKVESNGKGKRE